MNPDAPMSLKYFTPDDFHAVCGLREEFNTIHSIPDTDEGHGFRKGDKVEWFEFSLATMRDSERRRGVVTGIRDALVRVGADLHVPTRLKLLSRSTWKKGEILDLSLVPRKEKP